jgi:hypothetical protein
VAAALVFCIRVAVALAVIGRMFLVQLLVVAHPQKARIRCLV